MKKNKRNLNKFRRFLFFTAIGFFLTVYVFLYLKIIYIGYETDKLKEKYDFLNLLNKNYNLQIIKLTTPENLIKIAKEKNINLIVPKNWCYLEIKEENVQDTKQTGILEAETR
ncbi:MAG TPA: hypothetical protein PKV21_03320 [bacterium]|nr:hypothetical protein [bacterium]HOM26519.1 hypothetical protein [bacterium]